MGHEVGGPEVVVERAIKGDRPVDISVATAGTNNPDCLQGRSGAIGGAVGYDDFPPKREGGVSGDRPQ